MHCFFFSKTKAGLSRYPSRALVNQANTWNSQKDCDADPERCVSQVRRLYLLLACETEHLKRKVALDPFWDSTETDASCFTLLWQEAG